MSRYLVKVGLSYPSDPAVVERLVAGENLRLRERSLRKVEPGEIVDDLPEVSLPWLIQKGCVEPVPDAPPPRRVAPAAVAEEVEEDG